MITNQAITGVLLRIKETTGVELEVYTIGDVKVTAEGTKSAPEVKSILRQVNDSPDGTALNGRFYLRVEEMGRLQYLISGKDNEVSRVVAKMAAIQISDLIAAAEGRFGRDSFFKNLLMDNLLLSDIYHRANKLHIDIHAKRVAYLVELNKQESSVALSVVESLFADDESAFTTDIDEHHIVIIREVKPEEGEKSIRMTADTIVDMLNSEMMERVSVAYGNTADEIRKVANSYKEAKIALSVGKIFSPEQSVVNYASLGIGRLIYQLPVPMCKMFIEEIFKDQSPDKFDEETLTTINQFFASSLNVSETSRQLYIHRNTLVYRLDKIEKMTGLDLRQFDDAITFKIALMVVRYMNYMDNQEV